MNKSRDISLDLLRVLSCAMVFGVHLGQHVNIPGVIGAFFERGATGVSFFFILSGFLACFSLEDVLKKYEEKKRAILVFWTKRMTKILPLYYCVIAFYYIFFTTLKRVPLDETGLYWLRYVLFINTWVPAENEFWVNLGALWSISCFVLFYLIAPIYYLLAKKYGLAWIGVVASYGLMKIIDLKNIDNRPLRSLLYFFLGVLIFRAIKEKKEMSLALVSSFLVLFCFLTGKGVAIIPPLLVTLYILLMQSLGTERCNNKHVSEVIVFFSSISYSVYLIHAAVIEVFSAMNVHGETSYAISLIVLSVVISMIMHKYIEKTIGNKLLMLLLAKLEGKY